MSKALLYASTYRKEQDLHQQLLEGVERIALAVGSTLGPRGSNVIIDRHGDTPQVTKDGVTVARNIHLTDPVLNSAVKMIQQVARATVEEAGDGTTTATVLAHAILRAGIERLKQGAGAVQLQRAITAAAEVVIGGIRQMAIQPTDEQIAQVATIATNGNESFGRLVHQALERVGRDGLITIDDANRPEMSVELREGFQMDSGWRWPEFITDRERGVAVLENPYILITERQLAQGIAQAASLHDPGPLLSFVAGRDYSGKVRERDRRPLLIVCDDVLEGSDAAQTLLLNHAQKFLQICVVRAPGYGDLKRAVLQDLAMVTGGKVLTMDGGDTLSRWVFDKRDRWTAANLGQCGRVIVSNRRTILEGLPGDREDQHLVPKFAAGLREQAREHPDPAQREQLLQRAARLDGKVAVLKVGAQTEAEAKALRDAAEDAVLAVRCAVTEGIVPGGGLALYILAQQLENTLGDLDTEMRQGAEIVVEAMRAPLRLIASNAGEDPNRITAEIDRLWKSDSRTPMGYNAATRTFEDLVQHGIVDPAKVVRVAMGKAASIAALMLTTSCLVYLDPEANKAQPVLQLPPIPGGPRG